MRTRLVAYAGGDDALLLWTADVVDDGCQGFAIERRLRRARATAETREWLDNYAPPFRTPRGIGRHQRSIEWPFRSFTWTDHEVGAGDVVSYRVVPVFESAPAGAGASRWSRLVEIGAPRSARYEPFFNRGFVISQFMSRYLDQHYKGLTRTQALRQFKADAARVEDRLRIFLSGDLRTRLLALLDEVRLGDGHLYAALFELGDAELANALAALGPRAHVVLANGSIEVRRDLHTKRALETAAQARARDENAALRRVLVDAGADVEERNRFVSPGSLAHNKFLVVTDARGNARRAWTGSTNWTTTGLCTQLNNALLVNHAGVAAAYLRQWHALRDAGERPPRRPRGREQRADGARRRPAPCLGPLHPRQGSRRSEGARRDRAVCARRRSVSDVHPRRCRHPRRCARAPDVATGAARPRRRERAPARTCGREDGDDDGACG